MSRDETRRVGHALWMIGAVAAAVATLLPADQRVESNALCLVCGALAGVDLFLNVLLFVPIGAGLALAGVPRGRALFMAGAATVAIEALQLFAIPNRDASVADVLSNSLGAFVGFVLAAHRDVWLHPRSPGRWVVSWLTAWVVLQTGAAVAVDPYPSEETLHGQIARETGGHPGFAGQVLHAMVNGEAVPDHVLRPDMARRVRDAFAAEGVIAEVVVDSISRQPWQTPILRIVDRAEHELLVVASRESWLVFGIRTRAAALRLRPLRFRLAEVFDRRAEDSGDTVRARVEYSSRSVRLLARSGGRVVRADVPLHSTGFWRFLTPHPTYLEAGGFASMLDGVWVFAWLLPAGYWLSMAARTLRRRLAAVVVAVVGAGLFAVPALFETAGPPAVAVGGAIAGLLAGIGLRRMIDRRARVGPVRNHDGL